MGDRFIPYFLCLNCGSIYRADDLSTRSTRWDQLNITAIKCPECYSKQCWVEICPFETYVEETQESRCIIPNKIPLEVSKNRESWHCIYHNKLKECPVVAIFIGVKKRNDKKGY